MLHEWTPSSLYGLNSLTSRMSAATVPSSRKGIGEGSFHCQRSHGFIWRYSVVSFRWTSYGAHWPCQRQLAKVDQVLDSLPIMLAVRGRSLSTKVAGAQADQGYYESKQRYYHGVKLHLLGAKQYHSRTTGKGVLYKRFP